MAEHNRVLARVSRAWRVTSPVITRKMQLVKGKLPEMPRVVVLGDAAHIIDPSGGGGLTFALMEAELLLGHHLPRWLAEGEPGPEAIRAFYSDPRRQRAVEAFFARGRYIYDLNHDTSLPGRSRRLRFALQHLLASRLVGRRNHRELTGQGWRLPAPYLYEQYEASSRTRRGPKRSM
jgi:2-polyprenyl-6-methoxyphenol hydroxylase-like FAD-dependent oxidoreductase